jgi:hypothetical protein
VVETIDTLNIRVGIVESEVEGEKAVTRYNLEQVRLNTGELTAFRAEARLRLDRMVSDMALVKATQIAQGGTLNILVQDVRGIRTEMGAMRAEFRAEIGAVRAEMAELRAEFRTEIGAVRTEMGELRTEMGELRSEMNRRLGMIEQTLATIVAAVSPRNPA